MTFRERLAEYVNACSTGIWIESHEHEDALAEIASLARQENWRMAVWDVDQGLSFPGPGAESGTTPGGTDPLVAIRALPALATDNSSALLVLRNFHRFLTSVNVV